MGKVIEMPDPLERRAQKIDASLNRKDEAEEQGKKAHSDWRGATFDLAVELFETKRDLNFSDIKFGNWCKGRFGDNRLNSDDRAALVRWGEDPEGTREMLANTNSMSVQHIDRRFRQATKPQSPQRDRAKAFIHAYVAEHGVNPSYALVEEETGVSNNVVIRAFGEVKLEAEPKLTKGQNYDVEARIKVRMRELEKEFEARVEAETKKRIDILFPDLEKMMEDAKLNEKYYRELIAEKAVLDRQQYYDLVALGHNKEVSDERRTRAVQTLLANKLFLLREN